LALVSLLVSSYCEENVTDCATEAQLIIKLIQSGYALPVSTGSLLLGKFTHTSCEFFNQKFTICLTESETWNTSTS